jgi:hypothetical protein
MYRSLWTQLKALNEGEINQSKAPLVGWNKLIETFEMLLFYATHYEQPRKPSTTAAAF